MREAIHTRVKDTNFTIPLLLVIALTALLSSCVAAREVAQLLPTPSDVPSTYPNQKDCLPPVSSIGVVPIGVDVSKQEARDIPPHGWQFSGSLPETAYLYSFAVQNNDEIWISYSDPTDHVLRYRVDGGERKFYPPNSTSVVFPVSLFSSRDGVLWSKNYIGQKTIAGVPILSRYDESTDQFRFVLDHQGILQSPKALGSYIVEDNTGLFWMFLKDPNTGVLSLYSFNPTTLVSDKHPLQITANFASINLATDGQSIWTFDESKARLIQYFPTTREIHTFDSLPSRGPDEPSISLSDMLRQPLFVYYDSSRRLWLDAKGWLDFTNPTHPGFYKLLPSPTFVGYFEAPKPTYGLLQTFGMFESSDGLIWFTTNGGVIRLDIRQGYEKGQWCLVTNGYSEVEEDSQHNLWMIVFNKIYKYRIQP